MKATVAKAQDGRPTVTVEKGIALALCKALIENGVSFELNPRAITGRNALDMAVFDFDRGENIKTLQQIADSA